MTNPISLMTPLLTPEPSATPTDAKAAAKQFEELFVKQLIAQMPLPGMEGSETGAFLSMFQDALAKQLVDGGGLGLAAQIEGAIAHRPPSPSPSAFKVTSGFGMRADPFDGKRREHDGIDVAAPLGASIHAARDGVVRFAGEAQGYGNLVIVDHGGGLESRYAHCAKLSVRIGQDVAGGEAIATVGSTGRSTGPHLHFEVRRDGTPEDPGDLVGRVL